MKYREFEKFDFPWYHKILCGNCLKQEEFSFNILNRLYVFMLMKYKVIKK